MSAPSATPNIPSRVVVDASVAIKWFVPEVHAEAARRLLREGMILLAPDLIWAEVANALWRKWREKELAAETVQEILTDFHSTTYLASRKHGRVFGVWQIAPHSGHTLLR